MKYSIVIVLPCILLAGGVFAPHPSQAADIAWTNTSGGNWSAATNWSPNQVPGPGDTALITNDGTYAVRLDVSATVAGLLIGAPSGTQTFSNAGPTLTLDGPGLVGTNAVFAMTAGAFLAGSGELTVEGRVHWTGGTMQGAGKTSIAPGAMLEVAGSTYNKVLYRALDLRGSGTLTGGTWLYGGLGAPLTIFSGATFDILGDQQMPHNAGAFAVIQNFGSFRKTGGSGNSVVNFILNNSGLVQAQSGALSFGVGGWSDGQFDAANAAAVGFSGGTHVMTNGVNFTATGTGFHRVDAGTFDVATALTMTPPLELTSSGIIAGHSNLTCTSTLRWTGGTMQGAGRTIIPPGAALAVSGNIHNKVLYRALDLRGSGTLTGGTWLYGGLGAPLTIFSGATFDILGDQQMPHNAGAFAVIQNFGSFRKTGGSGNSVVNFILNNSGLVQAQSGALSFGVGGWSDGQFDAANAAAVGFSGGTHVMTNGVNFTATGTGFHRVDAGTFDVATALTMTPPLELTSSGIIAGHSNLTCTSTLRWTGGTMQGAGRTIIPPGAALAVSGNIHNKVLYRALDLRGSGTLTGGTWLYGGSGAPLTIFSGATFDILGDQQMPHNAGAFAVIQNFGSFRKTGGSGNSVVNFILNNSGLVQAQSGALSFGVGGWSDGQFDAANAAAVGFSGGTHVMTNGVNFTATGTGFHRVDAGTFDVATALTMTPPLELTSSGIIAGHSNLTCTSTLRWTGGTMQGAGRTIIPPGAALAVSGNIHNKVLYRALDLRGSGTLTGGTWLYGGSGAPLTIFSGATFDILGDQQMPHNAGAFAVIQNFGSFRKTGGSGNSVVNFILNNSGLVQAQSGALSFGVGGWSDGQFDAANAAAVGFSGGTHVMTNGVNFTATGTGFHRVDGATFDVATALTMNPVLELTSSGIIAGSSNLTCTSTLRWTGGTMQGAGRTIVAPGATLAVSGSTYSKVLYRALDLRGTGTLTGGTWLYGGSGAPLTIFSGATFDILGDQQMPHNAGAFAVIQNFGSFRKTGGTGNSAVSFIVTNHAVVESRSGTLSFPLTYVQNAGSTLLAGGGFGGVLLDIRGGELRGAGRIAADVRNWADVRPGGPLDFLRVSNNVAQVYSNTASGRLNLELGGLLPGTEHDQLRLNGQANLAGTINVDFINDFLPAVGNSFTVMTYTARSGVFDSILSPPGITLQAAYFPTHLVLNAVTVTQVPPFIITQPTNLILQAGLTATFRVVAGGTPTLIYQWQLNSTNLPGATSDTLVIPGVTVTNAGAYRVLVSNLGGLTNSVNALLIVEPGFQTIEIDTGNTNVLVGTAFMNGLDGAIVGSNGVMQVTHDGGGTWTTVNTGMTNITDVVFINGAIYIAGVGAHTICVSYDGGVTWGAAYTGPQRISRLRFLDSSTGYAVGDDGAILQWDGTAWAPMPNDIDVRLLGIDLCGGIPVAVGEAGQIWRFEGTNWVLRHTEVNLATFNDVRFCAGGGTGFAVGTGGVIYQTTDCGLTWAPYTSPVFGGTLNSIAFGDCSTLWVAGDDGAILQSTDGGQTWGTLYTGTTNRIREIVFIDGYGYYVDDSGHIHRYFYAPIPTNLPPVVALTSPSMRVTNVACVPLDVRAVATDPNGYVTRVEFLANGIPFGRDLLPAWRSVWTNDALGEFMLTAVATDNLGATAVSAPVTVVVIPSALHVLTLGGMNTNRLFHFCMTGEPGRDYEVYAHTNVEAPTATWAYLGLMTLTNGVYQFTDVNTTNHVRRFYRARQVP